MAQIRLNEIVVGEPLPFDVKDSLGVLLLRRGTLIDSDKTRDALISRGIYWADPSKEVPKAKPEIRDVRINPFEAVDDAFTRLDRVSARVGEDAHFSTKIKDIAKMLQDGCRVDPDAMLATILLDRSGRYSIGHCIDTAIVCEIVGQSSGISSDERLSIVSAALTMNIAMLEMQDKLQSMKVSLPPEIRKTMQTHPNKGFSMLRKAGVEDELWLNCVLHHHEAFDGSGYPSGISGDAISKGAHLIAISDVFTARIATRAYKEKEASSAAVRNIFQDRGNSLHPELTALMVKTVGLYPPGSIVRLLNNEIGVVTSRGENINQPTVHAIVGTRDDPLGTPLKRETSKPEYGIKCVMSADQAQVKINKYLLWC